ncbi:MAG: aminotransferase DegT [Candidatus Puniceispirillum sp.]|nr:aminotransferase DegT [Candidatus Puniceispirillum sp.]
MTLAPLSNDVVSKKKIEFIDLKAQYESIKGKVDAAILHVLEHGHYIMGPEVQILESQLSAFCGAKHSLGCANGTDALGLAMRALDIQAGDAVFVPSFTFAATAESVCWFEATPVFVDVEEGTYNMCANSLKAAIDYAHSAGLRAKGIIAVDIFGQPANYDAIETLAKENDLWLICDAAQSFGATYKGRPVGSIGDITTTSFFPAKPLGCYGDGGAVFTNNTQLCEVMGSLRVHGKGADKYDNVRIGVNSRLDTLQAAVLIEKLSIFPEELKARQRVADRYSSALSDVVRVPALADGVTSSWAQYTIRVKDATQRQDLMDHLKERGVPSVVYYIKPLHMQKIYAQYPTPGGSLPVTEALADSVLSLPMHPYMDEAQQNEIIEAVRSFF